MMVTDGCRRPRRRSRSLEFPVFSLAISLLVVTGLAGDSSSSKDEKSSSSSSNVGLKVLFICLGLVAVVAFSVFLYKVWQKKKRAEQHARLLKLFEDDDELEVELGIRD